MCTVTFIPTDTSSYIFTSSRDERYDRRETIFPTIKFIGKNEVLFPQDKEAKGTWFAVSKNRVACLLNGAFKKHIRTLQYKKSRGIMLLNSFEYETIEQFANQYSFFNMEPFTLILIQNTPGQLTELRWDGKQLFQKQLSTQEKHIWSSSTLYEPEVILERERWFESWHEQEGAIVEKSRRFHYKAGEEDRNNSVFLKRETKGTISITSLLKQEKNYELMYDDLENGIKKIDLENVF